MTPKNLLTGGFFLRHKYCKPLQEGINCLIMMNSKSKIKGTAKTPDASGKT